jgi:C4-dicarboxylate transporter DctM subunit
MSPETISSVGILLMFILLATSVPVAFAVGTAGLAAFYFFYGDFGLQMVSTVPWSHGFNYTLLALPLFVLMGHILNQTGIMERLFRTMSNWLSWIPGCTGVAALMSSAALAAASGSGAATQATVGTVVWPRLEAANWSQRLSFGLLLGGGSLGPLIPPSGMLILYGAITETSVGALFMAALIPGIVMTLIMMTYVVIRVVLNPSLAPPEVAPGWRERIESLAQVIPFAVLIFGVLGSIYFGWATPTESASLGVVLSVVLMVLYRRFSFKAILEASKDAIITSTFIIMLVVCASILANLFIFSGLPQAIEKFVETSHIGKGGAFLTLVIMYLLLGCFIDGMSIMVITVPLLIPLLEASGINLIWLGVCVVILIEVGTMTPPFGLHLFILQGVVGEKAKTDEVVRAAIPFIIMWASLLLILWLWPALALWLPGTLIR